VTVAPGAVAALTVTPASVSVRARASRQLRASGTDAFGNVIQVSAAAWTVSPRVLGTVSPTTGGVTTFTAGRRLGSGTVVASVATEIGTLSAGAGVRVTPGRLRIGLIHYRNQGSSLLVTVRFVDAAGKSVSRAVVTGFVSRDGRRYYSRPAVTGAGGRIVYRMPARRGGCFTTTIRRVSAAGFTWDGRTPRNRFCRRPQ
jgi:hypothetical protein